MAPKIQPHQKFQLEDWEWAYIAGFIDGEGCINPRIHPKRNPQIRLSASQRTKDPLLWIQERLGGRVRSRVTAYGESWNWTLSSNLAVIDALRQLYPFLIVKAGRAKVAYKLLHLDRGDPRIPLLAESLHKLNRKRTKS